MSLPIRFLLSSYVFFGICGLSSAFLYQPGTGGQIWDPSITWWRGKWYAHTMYQRPGDKTNSYAAGWVATSEDGAHWKDGGEICPEISGDMWFKGIMPLKPLYLSFSLSH